MKKVLLAVALAGTAVVQMAHGSEKLCVIAGQYQGSYVSYDGSDEGRVTVNVDPTTGIATGVARSSKTVEQLAIGGVVTNDGRMSSNGAVEGGARFTGQFSSAGVARGAWLKPISTTQTVGGAWELSRLNVAAGCEAGAN